VEKMVNGKKRKEEHEEFEYFTEKILMDPLLFERIVCDGLDHKIVEEDLARKCIFLCAMGSYVLNAKRTSYNLLVNAESGAGKDHVTDAVLKIMPNEIVQKRTRISPAALTYWHDAKWEPNWTWDGKILYLEDCSNQILNCDVFKVFTSGGSHATIVKDQRAVDIVIKGKPVVIITSASADPAAEMIRRFMVVNLNESRKQTSDVMKKWAENSMVIKKEVEYNDYHEALKYLLPFNVIIPWANKLVPYMNNEHLHMRTHFSRFLDLIKASAVVHQWQREKEEENIIIAEELDYNISRELIIKTASNNRMVPLTKNQKDIIENLKEMGLNTIFTEEDIVEVGWTHSELLAKLPFGRTQLYDELNKLVKFGFVNKTNYRFGNDFKKTIVYHYQETSPISIPTWEEMNNL